MASDLPTFQNLDDEQLAKIKASLNIVAAEAGASPEPYSSDPVTDGSNVTNFPSRRTPIGRKRRAIHRDATPAFEPEPDRTLEQAAFEPIKPAQTFSRRDEREVAERLQNLFSSLTGMPAVVSGKLYLQMTDEEAEQIAKPLASYLIRNEPTQVIAREILDNYDLLAIVVGVMAYVVRVYRDRSAEVEQHKPKPVASTIAERLGSNQAGNLSGQEDGNGSGEFPFPTSVPWNGPGL